MNFFSKSKLCRKAKIIDNFLSKKENMNVLRGKPKSIKRHGAVKKSDPTNINLKLCQFSKNDDTKSASTTTEMSRMITKYSSNEQHAKQVNFNVQSGDQIENLANLHSTTVEEDVAKEKKMTQKQYTRSRVEWSFQSKNVDKTLLEKEIGDDFDCFPFKEQAGKCYYKCIIDKECKKSN